MIIQSIKFLIDPFTIFWLLLLSVVIVWFLNRENSLRWLIITTCLWFLLISTPTIPNLVVRSLEAQYVPLNINKLENSELIYDIIVLGAGHNYDENVPANTLLSDSALRRLVEGIRLHRLLPGSRLILSGFSSVGGITGAEMLRKTALLIGVDSTSIELIEKPLNTRQEAKYYAKEQRNNTQPIIVTAAVHMPRAMMTFQRYGFNPIASPTDFRLTGSRTNQWIGWPDIGNIEKLSAGVYEYAGMLYYQYLIE